MWVFTYVEKVTATREQSNTTPSTMPVKTRSQTAREEPGWKFVPTFADGTASMPDEFLYVVYSELCKTCGLNNVTAKRKLVRGILAELYSDIEKEWGTIFGPGALPIADAPKTDMSIAWVETTTDCVLNPDTDLLSYIQGRAGLEPIVPATSDSDWVFAPSFFDAKDDAEAEDDFSYEFFFVMINKLGLLYGLDEIAAKLNRVDVYCYKLRKTIRDTWLPSVKGITDPEVLSRKWVKATRRVLGQEPMLKHMWRVVTTMSDEEYERLDEEYQKYCFP